MREIFLAPPCVNVGKQAAVNRQNPMYEETDDSCLPARSCQEANPMYEETACQRANSKVLGPAVYKNIAEFNEIENSSPYNGEDGAD